MSTQQIEHRQIRDRRFRMQSRLADLGVSPEVFTSMSDDELRREYEQRITAHNLEAQEQSRLAEVNRLKTAGTFPLRHAANAARVDPDASAEWLAVRDLIEQRVDDPHGYLLALLGSRGCGKTQAAVSAALRCCDQLVPARYVKALDLFREIRSTFKPGSAITEQQLIQGLVDVQLLIIDEVHQRGDSSSWEQSQLVNLIDKRYDALKSTVLIANLDRAGFAAAMGTSVVSRLNESGEVIECNWASFRIPGSWRNDAE